MKFSTADTDDMFRILDHNEADVIFTLDSHVYQKDYVIAKEERISTHFVVGADFPLAGKKNLSVKDIVEYPFLLTEKRMGYRRVFDDVLAKRSLEIQPVLEIGRTDMITSVLTKSDMISFLPDFVTKPLVDAGVLCYLDISDMHIEIWKQLIYHKNKWMSKSLRTVIAYIQALEFTN